MPKRIQRKRTKGWKMPENTVYVGRPTKYGNPFTALEWVPHRLVEEGFCKTQIMSRQMVIKLFIKKTLPQIDLDELKGKDLACWCRLDQPCHADILLEEANKDESPGQVVIENTPVPTSNQ